MNNILNLPTRFDRRWDEDNETREWVPDNRFDEAMLKFIENEVIGGEGEPFIEQCVTKHCLYCCASTPSDKICYELDDLIKEFGSAKAGDYILVWSLTETPNHYVFPCPDNDGLFPRKGAY